MDKEEIVKGRLLAVNAEILGTSYIFINIYAPNVGAERIALFEKLNQKLLNLAAYDVFIVIGGDWNCTLNFTVDRNGEEPHPKSANVQQLLSRYDLYDVWREQHLNVRQYTRLKSAQGRVCAARLDRFYVPKNERHKIVRSDILPVGFTDHHLTIVEIFIKKRSKSSFYWKFNTKLLEDHLFVVKFVNFWQKWKLEKINFETLSLWWEVGKV